jgi:hypothetical protein
MSSQRVWITPNTRHPRRSFRPLHCHRNHHRLHHVSGHRARSPRDDWVNCSGRRYRDSLHPRMRKARSSAHPARDPTNVVLLPVRDDVGFARI